MIKSEVQKKIKDAVSRVAEQEIKDIDSKVKKLIESSICSLLGLSNSSWGGKVEIDHCNGRNSVLTSVLESKARKQVERIVSNFKFNPDDKEVLEAFKKEFKEQFKRRISWHAEDLAKTIASQTIKKFTDKELQKIAFEPDVEIKPEVRY